MYSCKNREELNIKLKEKKTYEDMENVKLAEKMRLKKLEEERQQKIKLYRFNMDKDDKNLVVSKGSGKEPLEYADKIKIEELGIKYNDFYLEEINC